MKITKVTVELNDNKGDKGAGHHKNDRILAFAEIVFDYSFVVTNLRVVKGHHRTFIAMPSTDRGIILTPEGFSRMDWHDVAFPINQETRKYIEQVVFAEYDRVVAAKNEKSEESTNQE